MGVEVATFGSRWLCGGLSSQLVTNGIMVWCHLPGVERGGPVWKECRAQGVTCWIGTEFRGGKGHVPAVALAAQPFGPSPFLSSGSPALQRVGLDPDNRVPSASCHRCLCGLCLCAQVSMIPSPRKRNILSILLTSGKTFHNFFAHCAIHCICVAFKNSQRAVTFCQVSTQSLR